MSAHDCTTCQACGYCNTSGAHWDACGDPDAGGTVTDAGGLIHKCPDSLRLHVPADGSYLVKDGKVYRVHQNSAYVQIKATWRVRWAVTTDPEPMEI